MSLDHDLEDLMKTTAPSYRPAPGDLDSVMRVGRRRVVRRRVASAAGSTLVLLAVVATTLSLTGAAGFTPSVEEVATTLATTDGGVTVRILDLAPHESTVVGEVEGFELLTLPARNTAISLWDRIARRLGWLPDLAVYRSPDGSTWSRQTFDTDMFDDVDWIVDAVVVDGVHTLLVADGDETGADPFISYSIIQTDDFVEWTSVEVPVGGPFELPDLLQWAIENGALQVVGERVAVVTTVVPAIAVSARNFTWGYDAVTGWHGHNEAGGAISVPLEEVTPAGTAPTRTVVQVLDGTGTDDWQILPAHPDMSEGQHTEIAFDGTRWIAVTFPEDGPISVWKLGPGDSDWTDTFEAEADQVFLLDGAVYTLATEGQSQQVARWEVDGTSTPLGEFGTAGAWSTFADTGNRLLLPSGRTLWAYDAESESWSEHAVDFAGFETMASTRDTEEYRDFLSSPDNTLIAARVAGEAVLGHRSFSPEHWWIFELD
jgi:hypothetical protein